MGTTSHPLIYDWNHDAAGPRPPVAMLDDETLRDGLQSPSVRTPTIDEKIDILHHMDALGIDTADIGLPGGREVAGRAGGVGDWRRRVHGLRQLRATAADRPIPNPPTGVRSLRVEPSIAKAGAFLAKA